MWVTESLTITGRDTGVVGNKFMDHLQLTPDKPKEGVHPEDGNQRLREQRIIGMAAADMCELMIEDLPVERIVQHSTPATAR